MKKSYFFSAATILFTVLAVVGLLLVTKNAMELRKFSHPKQLNNASLSDLQVGDYVQCAVDEYVAVPIKGYQEEIYTGQSCSYLTGGMEYITYTAAIGEDTYVRIAVYDKNVVDLLEKFEAGKGGTVFFKGKAVVGDELDYDWYEGAKDFDVNNVRSDIVIMQVSGDREKNMLIAGVILLLLSLYGIKKTTSAF